jgi:hypothetical protein
VNSPLSFKEPLFPSKRWLRRLHPKSPLRQLIDDIPTLAEGQRGLVRTHLSDATSSETHENAVGLLAVKREGGSLVFNQVPGIHDVTARPELGIPSVGIVEDPFNNFSAALKQGFRGGPYCNVFVVEAPFLEHWTKCEYKGRPENEGELGAELIVTSRLQEFYGDRYRLVLWTGFSDNFAHVPDRPAAYATVLKCNPRNFEPFVIFDSSEMLAKTIEARIKRYRELLGEYPIQFVDRANQLRPIVTDTNS